MGIYNFCLIGNPVVHSLSPKIHNYFIFKTKLNAGYVAFQVNEGYFTEFISFLKENVNGFNVTLPYKEKIFNYLDDLDKDAKEIKAVNCVLIRNGKMIGYNTDYYGIMKTFEDYNVDIAGKDIVVLGCGGAAKPLLKFLKNGRYRSLKIFNRTVEKAEKVIDDFCLNNVEVNSLLDLQNLRVCDIMINTTSIGLETGEFVDLNVNVKEFAFDMQYNLKELTPFLKKVKGCKKSDGLNMLIYQAKKSFDIWTNTCYNFDINDIKKHLEG
ncbi:shikimate dehydrogenase [Deferribacter thermophilus]|uniref:shikimate dehydrogenase n=1 Tax=Deferribacter thermophilus TaxID=53573 RepID=UPI003C212D6C